MKYAIRKDGYLKARGNTAKFLRIKCSKCDRDILLYQKDGPGSLIRLYKDRIAAPPELVAEQGGISAKDEMRGLACPNCGSLVAVPMIYEPEKRLAYRVIPGTIRKLKSGGTWPPEENER
jgi:ribosomal protein S27E